MTVHFWCTGHSFFVTNFWRKKVGLPCQMTLQVGGLGTVMKLILIKHDKLFSLQSILAFWVWTSNVVAFDFVHCCWILAFVVALCLMRSSSCTVKVELLLLDREEGGAYCKQHKLSYTQDQLKLSCMCLVPNVMSHCCSSPECHITTYTEWTQCLLCFTFARLGHICDM